jgi:formylglycine-generating enzyme required for sulfatase activity
MTSATEKIDFSQTIEVARGGSWLNSPRSARVAYRNWYAPGNRDGSLGLRLVRQA